MSLLKTNPNDTRRETLHILPVSFFPFFLSFLDIPLAPNKDTALADTPLVVHFLPFPPFDNPFLSRLSKAVVDGRPACGPSDLHTAHWLYSFFNLARYITLYIVVLGPKTYTTCWAFSFYTLPCIEEPLIIRYVILYSLF